MKTQVSHLFTYGLLLFVMVLWGVNVVMLKVLVDHLPPTTMTAVRVFTAGIIVLFILIFQRQLRTLTKTEWKFTIIAMVFGVVGHHFFLTLGLTATTASNASLILALLPLTTSVLAMIFLHDQLTKLRLLGILLGIIGVSVIIFQGADSLGGVNVGDLYIFIAMFVQAISFIYIKKATETLDSKQMTGIMLVFGSLLLFGLSLIIEPHGVSGLGEGTAWIWLLFFTSAILATAVGHMLYNSAIHKLGAGQTAIFNNLVPFFGVISSAIFLGEAIVMTHIFGFLFIVIGVLLGTGYMDEKLVRKINKRKKAESM
ncbi:DMT family transporter [Desertibacillus haloalkaliphilus]|uniref:DMT family transporter n=1 Tax=Desertibacillus haloalkaliphilus TaxID=1328930 RepID=UPI001C275EA0|nr:DMT family transporter [Desertibacillus haloalkaliphilus]MBU8907347.1 DMT family transporter [Desertibacillus haloalkaliphilus]